MNLLQRAITAIRRQGLFATAAKLLSPLVDRLFDRKFGVETCAITPLERLTIPSENKQHGARYQPTRVLPLRKLFSVLRAMRPEDSVLVDIGCGKGRVLLLAAQHGFQEVRGLEFARDLCEIAHRNWTAFQAATGTRTTCRIIQADVTEYVIQPDETVFFLFNPFDEVVLSKVLANLAASLHKAPRRILLVFCFPRPCYQPVIAQWTEFVLLRECRFWGCDFTLYSNQSGPPTVPGDGSRSE